MYIHYEPEYIMFGSIRGGWYLESSFNILYRLKYE